MSKNYDYVLGQNSYDCGISSIMTILLYYGIKTSRETIISKLKKKDNGYTAYDLIRIAKSYGLDGYGLKTDINSLPKLPAIAHTIKDKNMFHFIVILENDKHKKMIKVMDPTDGIKDITYDDFKSITTNIFLVFEGKKKKTAKNTRFKKEITTIFKDNKKIIFKDLFLSIIYILASLLFNYYLKIMLSNYTSNIPILLIIFLSFFQIALLKNILSYTKDKLTYKISKKIDKDITSKVTNHIFNLPYEYFITKTTGELVTITQDIDFFKEVVTKIFVLSLVDIILISVILIYLFFLSISLALICLLLIIVLILITKKYQYIFNNHYIKLKRSKINYTSTLINYFTSFETIKNLNLSPRIIEILSKKYNDSLNNEEKYNGTFFAYNFLTNFFIDMFYLIIICLSLLLVHINNFQLFDTVLFSSIFYLVIGLLNQINESISMYKVYETSTDRVLDCLEVKEEVFNKTNFSTVNEIKFQNISYQVEELTLLKNTSLKINKGDKVFITGTSGIGKSTMMKLLLKYYAPSGGKIFIDNININDIDLSFIRNHITYIGQNETLFPGSILDNLKLVSNSKEEIDKASSISLLDEFLLKNNIDNNYLIEESGVNLSGGERKKLILTRGLLHFKDVLILDEVFNEISVEEERKILKKIFEEYKDKIVILISHRNNNIDLFNKKYTLEGDGRIHETK